MAAGRVLLNEPRLARALELAEVDAVVVASPADGQDPPEIGALADAALIACEALGETRDAAVAGASEHDLWRAYCTAIARRGGEFTFMTVGAGARSALIYPTASDYVLKEGDTVKYDVGVQFRRYHAEIGRTQAIGNVS